MPERSTQKMLFQDTSLSFNRETGFTDVSTASADLNTRTADHRLPVLLIVNGGYPASAGFSHWYRNSSITARLIHKSNNLATLEAEVVSKGHLVAKAVGTWYVFKANKI